MTQNKLLQASCGDAGLADVAAVGLHVVFVQRPLSVVLDQHGGRPVSLVGQQQSRFFVPQIRARDLSNRSLVIAECDLLMEDPGSLIDP